MGGICGWVGLDESTQKNQNSADILQAMGQELCRFDQSELQTEMEDAFALGLAGLACHRLAYNDPETGRLILLGQIRYQDKALEPKAFLRAWQEHGEQVLEDLKGRFILAISNPGGNRWVFAADRLASYPLVLKTTGNGLLFGSSSRVLNVHPVAEPQLRPQALMDFLYFQVLPMPERAFEGHVGLYGGQYAVFANGQLKVQSYWTPSYREDIKASFEPLRDEFRGLVKDSVARAVEGRNAGCFLSGGTDSSTLTGMLGAVTESAPRTFSIGFEEDGFDEMEYARITAKHFKADHHEYYVTPQDIVEMVPKIAEIYDAPFANASAVPAYFCARMAKEHGLDMILGGDGGDELFAGNKRYMDQQVFAKYERVPGVARALLEPAINHFPLGSKLWPVRKARSYLQQAKVPMPQRMETYNILNRIGVNKLCTSDFLAQVDPEHAHSISGTPYHSAKAGSMLNRMLALDLKLTLTDNDLPKVNRMCEMAGIAVDFPLLDDDLISFAARLHPDYKIHQGKLRWFFKEALRGFLPDDTLSKSKQGFGLPFGPWAMEHEGLRNLAGDSLQSLKSRGVIRPEFIDALWGPMMQEHPRYYGVTVWMLMTLEQWLSRHAPRWALS